MSTDYEVRFAVHEDHCKGMDTQTLRKHFLIESLFVADTVQLTYTRYERFVVGGIYHVSKASSLGTIDAVKANFYSHDESWVRLIWAEQGVLSLMATLMRWAIKRHSILAVAIVMLCLTVLMQTNRPSFISTLRQLLKTYPPLK